MRPQVATLTMRELFDFVVDPSIDHTNIDAALDTLRALAGRRATALTLPAFHWLQPCIVSTSLMKSRSQHQ